jgi:hypothetical protein
LASSLLPIRNEALSLLLREPLLYVLDIKLHHTNDSQIISFKCR